MPPSCGGTADRQQKCASFYTKRAGGRKRFPGRPRRDADGRTPESGQAGQREGAGDRLVFPCPLVQRVLHNPIRDTYAGWDDAANRQRLLDAAADAHPDWILFLDADERLDPTDATALRTFADSMREQRSARASETAEQVGVKMLIPMILFILPSILIVMGGTAFIRIIEMFSNL